MNLNLNYEDFVSDILETFKESMPEANFERVTVDKINESRDAVRVNLPELQNIKPTVYLDDLYQKYQKGNPPEAIVKKMIQCLPADIEKISTMKHLDKNTIHEKLFTCVVNREMNKKLLADVPHKDIEGTDLSLIVRFQLCVDEDRMASCMITNSNASALGMKPEDALEQAIENGKGANYICKGISEFLADEMRQKGASEEMIREFLPEKEMCYMLSTEKQIQGAAVLGYPEEIKKAMKSVGEEKCYILPSSIHEVILVPESLGRGRLEDLTDMVKTVNQNEVRADEILSNHVYFFDGNNISIADTKTNTKTMADNQTLTKNTFKVFSGKGASNKSNKQVKSKGPTR